MQKKIIMFQLPMRELTTIKRWGNIPYAAGMLKAMARQEGLTDLFDIEMLPSVLADHAGDALLIDYLEAQQPDIICASLYLWNSLRTIHIAGQLKARLPGLLFVVGGPEVCHDSPYIIENPIVDFGCVGEGEEVFLAILRAIADNRDPSPVPGLFWRRNGNMVPPSGYAIVEDLGLLPSPLRMGTIRPGKMPVASYETMRGCLHSCSYCVTGTVSWRCFPADRVVDDISILHENRAGAVRMACSNFLFHPDFFNICNALARINADRRMSFSCFSYAEDVTREKAEALKACNFTSLEIGLQTVNAKTLRTLRRRPLHEGRFVEGLEHLRKVGIGFSIDLIAGLPGESPEDVERSIAFLDKSKVKAYSMFHLMTLPGSPLRTEAKEMGIEGGNQPPYYVTSTPLLTQAQIRFFVKRDMRMPKNRLVLVQEFRLPRFCTLNTEGNPVAPLSGALTPVIPVTKLLVPGATNPERFADRGTRKLGSEVIIVFSNIEESLPSFEAVIKAVWRENPFSQIMPVFEVRRPSEADAVFEQCRRISDPNLVQKTIIANVSFPWEQVSPPKGFSLCEEIPIRSPGDVERLSACAVPNILADLSLELDAVELYSVLESLIASGKNIRYKNLAFFYLARQVRLLKWGKGPAVQGPVELGNIFLLDGQGEVVPHLSMTQNIAFQIGYMQLLFMRKNGKLMEGP